MSTLSVRYEENIKKWKTNNINTVGDLNNGAIRKSIKQKIGERKNSKEHVLQKLTALITNQTLMELWHIKQHT